VSRDYGTRGTPRARLLWTVALVGMAPVVLLVAHIYLREQNANVAVAKAWDIKGAPCPTLTAAEFAQKRYTAKKTFDYDGILIGRHSGHVSCSDVKQGGGRSLFVDRVCQFTSPAVITVTTKAGAFFFVPGVGQPATVIVHGAQPRCVMASDYTLENS
jgi:hypothetical protein